MPEKFEHKDTAAPIKSPQEQLEDLMEALEGLKSAAHTEMPEDVREAAILANEQNIQKLKAQYPELNN